jgi:mono/diheme cytochrome c family protein
MRGVVRGLFGGFVFASAALGIAFAMGASAIAQAPAGPPEVPAEAKKMKSAVPSSPKSIEAGAQLYGKFCRFCHGNTGKADSPMAPKDMQPSNLADTTWVRGSSDGEIFWIIQNGAPPKYQMKGLKGKISDTDTWNLVNFVRSLGGVEKSH